jgi:hypothetical protein
MRISYRLEGRAILAACSRRRDFPPQAQRPLISVAANKLPMVWDFGGVGQFAPLRLAGGATIGGSSTLDWASAPPERRRNEAGRLERC